MAETIHDSYANGIGKAPMPRWPGTSDTATGTATSCGGGSLAMIRCGCWMR